MDNVGETVITDYQFVSGIKFDHGYNNRFEFYIHIDNKDWLWKIFRHRGDNPNKRDAWLAMVAQPNSNKIRKPGKTIMLNMGSQDLFGKWTKGPLYDLGDVGPNGLLPPLAELIKHSRWPKMKIEEL